MSTSSNNPFFKSRVAVNLIFFLNGFLFVSWAARTPLIQSTFQLDYKQLGFVLLSASLGSVIAMPLAGFLINKFGSKWVTLISAIFFFSSIPLFTLSVNYLHLLISFCIMGASVGIMDVSMNGQAVEIEKRYGKPIMSFFHALFSVGMMSGAVSVSLVEKIEIPLFWHLSFLALIATILILFISKFLISDDSVEQEISDTNKKFFLPKGPIIIFGCIAFCCMLGEGAMAEWTANYMVNVGKSTDYIAPFALFSFSGAMAIGRFLGDSARIKYGDSKLIVYGGAISSIGLLLAILFPSPIIIICSLAAVGIGLSTIVPIVYSLAGNIPGVKAGVGISAVTTIGYSGFILGPPVIGFLSDLYTLRVAWCFILILFVLMSLLSLRNKAAL